MAEYGTHQTKLYLCNVPWDNTYSDTRLFDSATEQYNYFYNLNSTFKGFEMDNSKFRFIDGDGTNPRKRDVKVSLRPEVAQTYNYAFYSNDGGTTWHYMFINSADYINYETALLHLEEDLIQSYMFNYQLKDANIVRSTLREYTKDSAFTSDYMISPADYVTETRDLLATEDYRYYLALQRLLVVNPTDDSVLYLTDVQTTTIGDAIIPYAFMCFDTIQSLYNYMDILSESNKNGSSGEFTKFDMNWIVGIGVVSKSCLFYRGVYNSVDAESVWEPDGINDGLSHIRTPDPQEPGKYLYSYEIPYSYVHGAGGSFSRWYNTQRTWEYMEDHKPLEYKQMKIYIPGHTVPSTTFNYEFYPAKIHSLDRLNYAPYTKVVLRSPSGNMEYTFDNANADYLWLRMSYTYSEGTGFECIVVPEGYNDSNANNKNPNYIKKFPCGYSLPFYFDDYTQRMAIEGEAIAARQITYAILNIASAVGMGMSGNYLGAGMTLASGAANLVGEKISLQEQKNHSTEIIHGDIPNDMALFLSKIIPQICICTIHPKVRQDTFRYLQKYGVATNLLTTPDIKAHRRWDYLQTRECTIYPIGSTPFMNHDAKITIQNIYDKGIRFWHINDIGNYINYANPIKTN